MPNQHGSFIWYELLTGDAHKAKAFYDAVIGWRIQAEAPPGGMDYRMIEVADGNAGGVMQITPQMTAGGARPGWLGYIGVDDVDATVAAITADGATVHMPPFDIPGVGRLAMVSDPQGVVLYVMRGARPESSNAYQRRGLQHVSWNELSTSDGAAALAFYGRHFGFRKMGGMPMGALGEYSFIANAESQDDPIGAVMRTPPGAHPGWAFYFRVPDIHAAKQAVEAGGGTVLNGPDEVPGGEFTLHALDPEGAFFGLVAPGGAASG